MNQSSYAACILCMNFRTDSKSYLARRGSMEVCFNWLMWDYLVSGNPCRHCCTEFHDCIESYDCIKSYDCIESYDCIKSIEIVFYYVLIKMILAYLSWRWI